ncbi:hypothetical protein NXX54_00975 [Bacteroides sp. BFG-638]|nr:MULTISPECIES: hypothetical protein [Bacteroides]MCS2947028.1 hypothetical protein [Bacteroides sp. BFG-638]MCS3310658.1 hypothetical protein [Bacteroides sp. BFG-637]
MGKSIRYNQAFKERALEIILECRQNYTEIRKLMLSPHRRAVVIL